MKTRTKKNIKIIGLIAVIIGLSVGIFFLGRKTTQNAKSSKTNEQKTNQEKEIENIQTKLQQIQDKLATETNSDKKQKLQTEIGNLKQQLSNLKSGNNPINPPINKTHRQITVKYNTEVGGKHEYTDINDNQKRFLIDTKNKIFSSASDLTVKDKKYNFSFYEEDATKKGIGFIFDTNNDKFQLTPTTTAPLPSPIPPKNPNSGRIEEEIALSTFQNEYLKFTNNLRQGDWDDGSKKPILVLISKNNPAWGGKNWDEIDLKKVPNFKISFSEKDATKHEEVDDSLGGKSKYYFDENNNNFTLTALGNWPDDNSGPGPTSPPGNQTPPPSKKKITLKAEYLPLIGTKYYCFSGEGKTIFISQKNPSVNKILKKNFEYKISFELEAWDAAGFETQKIRNFDENEIVEVVEET